MTAEMKKRRADEQSAKDKALAEHAQAEAAKAADGSASLANQEIDILRNGDWKIGLASPELSRMVGQMARSGQKIVRCLYGPAQFPSGTVGHYSFSFWYKERPANIDALLQADPKGALHGLGAAGFSSCPPSAAAAEAARNVGAVQSPVTIPARPMPDSRRPQAIPDIKAPTPSQHVRERQEREQERNDRLAAVQQRKCATMESKLGEIRIRALADPARHARRLSQAEATVAKACSR